jgi:VIT family
VLGVASLVADGFAMGEGNYSGTKAELERKHIALVPSGEREEIRQTFVPKGFPGGELERFVDVITCDEDRWAKTTAVEEYGLSPIVKSPILAAVSTSAAFLLCGLLPALPTGCLQGNRPSPQGEQTSIGAMEWLCPRGHSQMQNACRISHRRKETQHLARPRIRLRCKDTCLPHDPGAAWWERCTDCSSVPSNAPHVSIKSARAH